MINLTKAILHLLDGAAGTTILSQLPLDLADDTVYGYVNRQLERAAGDSGLHGGEFIGAENEFRRKLGQYDREMLGFEPFSAWIAGEVWQVISASTKAETCALLIAEYYEGETKKLAVLKLAGRQGFLPEVGTDAQGGLFCTISSRSDFLPGASQKAEEAAFFVPATEAIQFYEKARIVDGAECPLFSKGVLHCTQSVSAGETVKLVQEIAQMVAETYGEDKTVAVARVRAGIAEKLDANDQLAPFDLGEEVFAQNEEMQQEFRRQVSAAGVPERVSVPKKLAAKEARSQRIRTDTGIEITFPLDYAENTDYLEFLREEDGTIAIQIKRVGSIENKG